MNNETPQAGEASSSSPSEPPVATLHAKTNPGDTLINLASNLHVLILITISALYCLDCFSLLYLLRFISQSQVNPVNIRIVISSNLVCILTHALHSLPKPERNEFWNHGGLLVDFVGEKPTGRFKLLLLDFIILGLQILFLSLHYKKLSLDAPRPAQDLEAEEAGVSRNDPPETEEGIEMQSLVPDGTEENRDQIRSQAEDDGTILLRKADFKQVFLGPPLPADAPTGTESTSTSRLQLFFQRLEAIRARRAAQEAAAQRPVGA